MHYLFFILTLSFNVNLVFYVLLEFRTLLSSWRAHRSHTSRSEVVYGHTARAPVFKVRCGQSVLALERRRSKTDKHSRCLPQVKVCYRLSGVSFALQKECWPRLLLCQANMFTLYFVCWFILRGFLNFTPHQMYEWVHSRSVLSSQRSLVRASMRISFSSSREYWPFLKEFETVQKFYRRRQKCKFLIANVTDEGHCPSLDYEI